MIREYPDDQGNVLVECDRCGTITRHTSWEQAHKARDEHECPR